MPRAAASGKVNDMATYVYDAVRTPFGRAGGALSGVRPDDLAAVVMKATIERTGLDPARIDEGELLAKLPRDAVRIVPVAPRTAVGTPDTRPLQAHQVDLSFYALAGLLLALAAESLVGARR